MIRILTVNGIDITVEKKKIKNIHLMIKCTGEVSISIPNSMTYGEVEEFIWTKMDWIIKNRSKYEGYVPEKECTYESGDTVSLFGRDYVLSVRESKRKGVLIDGGSLILSVPEIDSVDMKRKAVADWYRGELGQEISRLLEKWEPVMGVHAEEWHVKNMRTKWGTCNTSAKRIWINLRLVERPPECLEFIIVHELCHLLERNHSKVFYGHMDRFLPEWREIKASMNKYHLCS